MSKHSDPVSKKDSSGKLRDNKAYEQGYKMGCRDAGTGKYINPIPGKDVTGIASSVSKADVWQFLSGEKLTGSIATATEKMEMAREGVDKQQLENLKNRAGLDYDKLADVLPATRATLLAKKGKEKFSPVVSAAIVSIADIYTYGYQVFEDEQRFNDWIREPLQALGGATPFSLLDNQFGREEVRDLIGRIAYGVYS